MNYNNLPQVWTSQLNSNHYVWPWQKT